MFFLISAMLTWKSLDKIQKDEAGNDEKKTGFFYLKKFTHIIPIYYFTMIVALTIPELRFNDYSVWNYVMHGLLLHGFHPDWINPFDLEWYIAHLTLWYLIVPFLHKVIQKRREAGIAVIVSVIVCAIYTVFINALFGLQIIQNDTFERYFHTFCFFNQLPGMLIGVYLYYLVKNRNILNIVLHIGISIVCSAVFVYFHFNKRFLPSSLIASLLFGCIILLLYHMRDVAIFHPIEWMGKHSLGIYLTHYIVIRCLSNWCNNIGWIMALMIVLAITFLVGYWTEKGNSYIGDHLMKLINVHK